MAKRSRSILIGFLISLLPVVFIVLSFVFLIFRETPMPSAKVVEIGRVPNNLQEKPLMAAVLPGSSDVLVFSQRMAPISRPSPAPGLMGPGPGMMLPRVTNMFVYRVSNTVTKKLLDVPADCSPAVMTDVKESFTPNHKFLLVEYPNAKPRQVGLVDMRSGRVLWTTPDYTRTDDVIRPFSDDGKLFVAVRGQSFREIWIFDTATGKPVKCIATHPKSKLTWYYCVGFIRGSKRIQYDQQQGSKAFRYVYDLNSGKSTRIRRVPSGGCYCPSPSGNTYVSMRAFPPPPSWSNLYKNNYVVLRDNSSRKIRNLYISHGNEKVKASAWSPDGRFMAINNNPDDSRWIIPRRPNHDQFVLVIDANTGHIITKYQHRDRDIELVDWYPDSSGVICLHDENGKAVVTKLVVK